MAAITAQAVRNNLNDKKIGQDQKPGQEDPALAQAAKEISAQPWAGSDPAERDLLASANRANRNKKEQRRDNSDLQGLGSTTDGATIGSAAIAGFLTGALFARRVSQFAAGLTIGGPRPSPEEAPEVLAAAVKGISTFAVESNRLASALSPHTSSLASKLSAEATVLQRGLDGAGKAVLESFAERHPSLRSTQV